MISAFTLALFLCFPWNGIGTKVFTFQEGSSDPDDLSSATLTNAPNGPLPDNFVICSSNKQIKIYTNHSHTVYVLYEDPNFAKPWFSLTISPRHPYVLWANTRFYYWYDLGHITREAIHQWVHICVEVDTVNGTLGASINGGNVTTVNNVEGLTPVPKLHLRLGVGHNSDYIKKFQSFGYVANINVFTLQNRSEANKENNLLFTSSSVCSLNDAFWTHSEWSIVGMKVKEEELNKETICTKSKVFNVRLPLLWNFHEATDECRKYGTHANISKPPHPDMKNVTETNVKHIYGEHFEQCRFFWTPFTDEYSEGSFVDGLTNETINNIQWHPGKPDGGVWQNYVGFMAQTKTFNDLESDREICVSCEIERSTTFTLRGMFKNSFLDTEYVPKICRGYIGFVGDTISIW